MADEIKRRLVHISGTGMPAFYLAGIFSWQDLQLFLLIGSGVAAVLEVIRLSFGLDWWIYDKLTREYEQDNPAGYALYMFSLTVVVMLLEPDIAIPAMLMLTLGDPISGVLGSDELRAIKRPRVLVTMFGICLLVALPFLTLSAALLAAAAATVADGVKPRIAGFVIDDNLSIPLAAGLVGWFGVTFLPALA
ncbi:Dolichol kinase [Natronoarchaeum philippinense]|uniref:Dolichol kinase n=1 Tax=Natronoarchaeum philippinense TaxID=558529 RepID=A0A285NZR4_NATPI|nr:dolichol kinase [Natronoarchaeum philippinense]SNZ14984.1 Dolichol kinase [Natronoarchaeum philippinense]